MNTRRDPRRHGHDINGKHRKGSVTALRRASTWTASTAT
jgi:hypothetical protein